MAKLWLLEEGREEERGLVAFQIDSIVTQIVSIHVKRGIHSGMRGLHPDHDGVFDSLRAGEGEGLHRLLPRHPRRAFSTNRIH